jgi:hypothetical protein
MPYMSFLNVLERESAAERGEEGGGRRHHNRPPPLHFHVRVHMFNEDIYIMLLGYLLLAECKAKFVKKLETIPGCF